ncbi:MAG: DUF3857 domain-containing protein [bacterium]
MMIAWNRSFVAGFTLLMLVAVVHAKPMTYSGRMDIGEMLALADSTFDMAAEDAVVLLAGHRETILPDGRRSVLIHRIVRIATDHALDTYADLRIPYDDKRQELKVHALRVWRESDQRWIEHRPTAIVETTPFELSAAPAYTNVRETMLLHDGVELPCILECAYTIEDKEPFRRGTNGTFIFQEEDPVVWSWLIFEIPRTVTPVIKISEGVSEAERSSDPEHGLDRWSWKMGPLPAKPDPETADPAAYLPHISWSTWENWNALGRDLEATFRGAMTLDKVLKDSVKQFVSESPELLDRARKISDFVNRTVAPVHYDDQWFWPSPRTTGETWASAYGCGLDRSILVAALAVEAGFEVWPVFRGSSNADIDEGVATLGRMEPVALWISGEGVEAYYDAQADTLITGLSPILGRSVWVVGRADAPEIRGVAEGETARLEVMISLKGTGNNDLTGEGHVTGYWTLNPYNGMDSGEEKGRETLGEVVGGVIDSAQVGDYSTTTFDMFTIAAGFEMNAPLPKEDAYGRLPIKTGEPGWGILDLLGNDVQLYSSTRGTPVYLQSPVEQTVGVELTLPGRSFVYLPEPVHLTNDAGSYRLEIIHEGETVTLRRTLLLVSRVYTPDQWPALRALLLAETDPGNCLVLAK